MGKTMIMMLLWLSATATVCRSLNGAERGIKNVKERLSGTWSDWALNKLTSGLGLKQDDVKEGTHSAVDKASEAASRSTSTMHSAASEFSKYVSQKTGEVGSLASEKAGQAMGMAGDAKRKAALTYDNVGDAIKNGKVKAYEAYTYLSELAQKAIKKVQNITGEKADKEGHSAYDSVPEGAGPAMNIGSDMTNNAKKITKGKTSDVYGYTSDKSDPIIRMPTDGVSEAKEKVEIANLDGKNKAQDACNSAIDMMSDMIDNAQSKASELSDKASTATDKASDKAGDAKASIKEEISHVRDQYDVVKATVDDSYEIRKDSMKDQAKETYEVMKEKSSDAAGNIGAAMRP